MTIAEYNFDGLVGPTHNYAGLSHGNLASTTSRHSVSNPRAAALEGLAKMRFLADLGIGQAVLPPQLRPDLRLLRATGFAGTDAQVVETAARTDPVLLAAAYSSSSMWAANSATISPTPDSADGRLHVTPANLLSTLHRSIETTATWRLFQHLFGSTENCIVHAPLPCSAFLADEGAANHTRLCARHGEPGIELFVFGRAAAANFAVPSCYPARQTLEASQALARNHQLDPQRVLFIQQNPAAIDAGVFHNDVAAVGHRNVLLLHEDAWVYQAAVLKELAGRFQAVCHAPLHIVQVPSELLPLADAVATYLFNSQIIDLPDGTMRLVAPIQCRDHPRAQAAIAQILGSDSPITSVDYIPVNQSMRNGGGPACLRLRMVLSDPQRAASRMDRLLLTPSLHDRLATSIRRLYREVLEPCDLADPALIDEARAAVSDLHAILELPEQLCP